MTLELDKKAFQERLHRCLDGHLPQKHADRVKAFAEIFDMPKPIAEKILNGTMMPSKEEITLIANEFEVDPEELIGKPHTHHRSSR